MEDKTLALLYDLKDAIDNDPRIIELKEKESLMSASSEVASLSAAMKKAEDEFEECMAKYGEKSEMTMEKKKALFSAKLALDEHPLVQDYTRAYIVVRDLYLYLDDVLFLEFRSKHTCEDKQ